MRCVIFAATLGFLGIVPSTLWSQRQLSATPFQPAADTYGQVTLTWSTPSATRTQIRVGSAKGQVFNEGGPAGTAQTGRWVTEGTRFFLQDVTVGEPGMTMASLTVRAAAPPNPGVVYYIAASATSWNTSSKEPIGAVLIFDRETTDLLARFNFPVPAYPASASPDGATLYVLTGVGEAATTIAVVDLATVTIRAIIPVPKLRGVLRWVRGAGRASRILASTWDGVAIIDPSTNAVAGSVSCPMGPIGPDWLVYNPLNRRTYGGSDIRPDICVITPEFQADLPLRTAGLSVTRAILLENNDSGLLLTSSWNRTAYETGAIDLRTSRTLPVPALAGVYPALVRQRVLYGVTTSGRTNFLQRYEVNIASDGTPSFTPQLTLPALVEGAPTAMDDRFVYFGIGGYCGTIEGPVLCSVGFRMVDAMTLQPRAENGSVVLAELTNALSTGPTLFGQRSVNVGVVGSYRIAARAPGGRSPGKRAGDRSAQDG